MDHSSVHSNLSIQLRLMLGLTVRSIYPPAMWSQYPLHKRQCGPQSRSGSCVNKNTPASARSMIMCLYRCGSLVADRKDLGWSIRAAPNISRGHVQTLRHWCNCLINDAGCEVSTVASTDVATGSVRERKVSISKEVVTGGEGAFAWLPVTQQRRYQHRYTVSALWRVVVMEKESVSRHVVCSNNLARLSAREDFIRFYQRGNLKTYGIDIIWIFWAL